MSVLDVVMHLLYTRNMWYLQDKRRQQLFVLPRKTLSYSGDMLYVGKEPLNIYLEFRL